MPGGSRTWGHPLTRTKIRPLKSEARLLMGFRPKARNIEGPGVAAVVRLRPSHSLDLRPVAGSEFEAAQIQSRDAQAWEVQKRRQVPDRLSRVPS